MASNPLAGLQPLQPTSNGLQPNSWPPTSSNLLPMVTTYHLLLAMASNLLTMASNLLAGLQPPPTYY